MSSLFNLKLPLVEKPVSKHPWQSTIKDSLSNRIKHAHNSVQNPCYPKIKEKVPDANRAKFTVIGDRITKEFIYCVHLVKGLHKYRWKSFDVPTIRGVTTLEWPDVWGSLKLQYGGFAHCLKSSVAVLINDKFVGGEDELKELVETKYIYHLILDYRNEAIANFASYIRCSGRPCAYMQIAVNDEPIGTLIFMLYADLLPYTCQNFLRLCKETKGGYGGTPIHRIVKDGWVQGGGFGLKSTDLDCENFMIPHDKRGVLCMANDGRHVDCSTQFFILLQPAPWMAYKYVAFGQLIEGKRTLETIENVPTWYESPMSNIIIYKAGIFNMECQDIVINKGANEYISKHIEDLNALGELLIEKLIERMFLEIELRMVERLRKQALGKQEEEEEEEKLDNGPPGNLHATQRFRHKKEQIEKHIQSQRRSSASQKKSRPRSAQSRTSENKEFDVEEYELEETDYKHISLSTTLSLIVKPEQPYYIPLTDVPYPGEVDSAYDLKKFLKGHYCLESDLDKDSRKKVIPKTIKTYPSQEFNIYENISDEESSASLDSEDEKEIREYLRDNVDRVSFAGGIIKNIGRRTGKYNLFEGARKSELINDDQLRKLRLVSADLKHRDDQDTKVSISVPIGNEHVHTKIKRRQTGFVRPEDLEKIHVFKNEQYHNDEKEDDEEGDHRKVRISPSTDEPRVSTGRRPTGFIRPQVKEDSDTDLPRQSVMQRLYNEVSYDDEERQGPTLKDYRPFAETHQKSILLTYSPNSRMRGDETVTREKFIRHSITVDEASFENVLNLQHGKKVARKISSDYVKTIDQIEHKVENSLRTIEFAKARPSMRVSEYQIKNQKYLEDLKASKMQPKTNTGLNKKDADKRGLRLPGDSPLYSLMEM